MKSSKTERLGNTLRLVAGGLVAIPAIAVYVAVSLGVGIIFFGALFVSGLNVLLGVVGVVVNIFRALGLAATIIIALVAAFGLLQRKSRIIREKQMQALLDSDVGVRYCNILLKSRALQALPLPADSKLDVLTNEAGDNIDLEAQMDTNSDDHAVLLTELENRRQAISSELNTAGVDPIQFSHFVLTKAVNGDLPTAMELDDELITL